MRMARDLIDDIEREFEKIKRQMEGLKGGIKAKSEKSLTIPESPWDISYPLIKTPPADIYETDDEVVAKIDIPGVKKEDIKLEVRDGMLKLKTDHREEREDKKKDYHKIERSYTGFMRSFTLPSQVDEKKVSASYNQGTLEVHMPKVEDNKKDKGKYVEIK